MTAELYGFFISIAAGAFSLLIWDFIHGLRTAFFKGFVSNALLDIAWWITAASIWLSCAWFTDNARLRLFFWVGITIGAVLYHFTLSAPFRRLFCVTFDIISKIFKFIFKIVLTPARFLYKMLLVGFCTILKNSRKRGYKK